MATAPPADPPLACDLLLDGFALVLTDGRPAAAPVLRRAVAAFATTEVAREEMLRWGWLASRAANYLWDYDRCLEIGMRAVRLARELGALEVLTVADNVCGQAAAVGGDFASAALLIAEVDAVTCICEQPMRWAISVWVRSSRKRRRSTSWSRSDSVFSSRSRVALRRPRSRGLRRPVVLRASLRRPPAS